MFTTKQYRAKAVEYGELVKTSTGPNQREFQQLEQRFTVLADNELSNGSQIIIKTQCAPRSKTDPTT